MSATRRKAPTVALGIGPSPRILAEAQQRGWRLVQLQYCRYVIPPGLEIEGALLETPIPDPRTRKILARVRAAVRIGVAPTRGDRRLPAILPDQAAEGRLAAEHFAERGFHHVGYVGNRPLQELRTLFERFRDRAAELGMKCHLLQITPVERVVDLDSCILSKQKTFTDWLRTVPQPLGLLAPNDKRAARYAMWAAEAGFRMPVDIAILGRGNRLEICESAVPPLSSIDMNAGGRIGAACDLLARLMAGEPPPRAPVIVPPTGIVERESTRLLATPDPDVAAALRYLWDHLAQDLSVNDVARAVGVARRKLERAFQRSLRRGINDELRRKRLEERCRLLLATDLPVAQLGPAVGFRSLTNLNRAFKAAHGMTPQQYRTRNAE